MVVDFKKYLKKKRYEDAGLDYYEENKYKYSHPPDKRPSERIREEQERRDYIQSVIETAQFNDYVTSIETFYDRRRKKPKTVWDELMDG